MIYTIFFLYTVSLLLAIALFFSLRRKKDRRRPIGGSVYLKHRNHSLQIANSRMAEQNYRLKTKNYDAELYKNNVEATNTKISQDYESLKLENRKLNSINQNLLAQNHKMDKKIKGTKTQLAELAVVLKSRKK